MLTLGVITAAQVASIGVSQAGDVMTTALARVPSTERTLMETRVVVVALLAAAILGILTGGVVALVAGVGEGAGAQASGSSPSAGSSPAPEPVPPTPTATPADDRPSPDVGYVTAVNDQDGRLVLVFDRTTVLEGDRAAAAAAERDESVQPGGWYLNNDNDRTRDLHVTDAAIEDAEAVGTKLEDGDADAVAVVVTYDDEGEVDTLRELTLV
jgi:hypothetical protein